MPVSKLMRVPIGCGQHCFRQCWRAKAYRRLFPNLFIYLTLIHLPVALGCLIKELYFSWRIGFAKGKLMPVPNSQRTSTVIEHFNWRRYLTFLSTQPTKTRYFLYLRQITYLKEIALLLPVSFCQRFSLN